MIQQSADQNATFKQSKAALSNDSETHAQASNNSIPYKLYYQLISYTGF